MASECAAGALECGSAATALVLRSALGAKGRSELTLGRSDWLPHSKMRHIICYDITDDRRREHLSGILLDFGRRVQESVFVADLDEELALKMKHRVKEAIDVATDRVHIFVSCSQCTAKAESVGAGADLPKDEDFYIL